MNFISLDLGTTTGFAISDYKNIISTGSINFKPTKFESHGIRYKKFQAFLDQKLSEFKINQCYFEEVRMHRGVDAAHMYGGFLAILQNWCIDNSIEYLGVSVGTIKKHITGHGRADKAEIIFSVKNKLGLYPKDDNEADAIALCDYCIKKLQ